MAISVSDEGRKVFHSASAEKLTMCPDRQYLVLLTTWKTCAQTTSMREYTNSKIMVFNFYSLFKSIHSILAQGIHDDL